MVKTHQRITAVVLSVLLLLCCVVAGVGNVSINAQAASGDVIYFEKPSDWSTASCYVWGGTSGANASWPGKAMTLVSGNVYSYTMPGDQTSVIFNNGNNGSQTADLTFQGGNKIFKVSGTTSGTSVNGAWSDYGTVVTTPIVLATPGTSSFTTSVKVALTVKNVDSATYSIDGAAAVKYTDGQSITLGESASVGDKITLKLTATNGTDTATQTYTYTKTDTPVSDGAYAYLQNDAAWSNCYVYYWNGNKSNAAWPGTKLSDKDASGNYEVSIPAEYIGTTASGVIFNDGGSNKSADLKIAAGDNKIYNNKTASWEDYDTSAIKFSSFSTDLVTPQYKGTDVTISANAAGGSGAISYRFTATLNGSETVLSDYSTTTKSVKWTPSAAGTYTLKCQVKDTANNTNERTLSYVVKDDTAAEEPVLKGVTPTSGSEIKQGAAANLQVRASGGQVGTNLLFYKIAITDPIGNPVNLVYYRTASSISFTPSSLGAYSIAVSVQNSSNLTVQSTYTYQSVTNVTPTNVSVASFSTDKQSSQPIKTAITLSATASNGTAPYTYQFAVNGTVVKDFSTANTCVWTPTAAGTYTLTVTVKDSNSKTATKDITGFIITTGSDSTLRGDANLDGKVNMRDAAIMQNYIVDTASLSTQQFTNADVTNDKVVNMKDISKLQRYLNDIITEL